MKTRVYLVRHAEALGNVKRTMQGRTDYPVTARGERQLDYLAGRFREIGLEAVYTSPLLRARQTAQAVNRYHGLPLQMEQGLIEIDFGELEGRPWEEMAERFPEAQAAWDKEPWNFQAPGGESMRQVYNRMTKTLERLVKQNEGKTIALVSHGCALRNLVSSLHGGIGHMREVMWVENTAVTCIDYEQGKIARILLENDASHLPPELLTLAKQDWWKDSVITDGQTEGL